MRDFEKRLIALEARPRPAREKTPAELRHAVRVVSTVEACLVAFYLGDWQPGVDPMAALNLGLAKTTSKYCEPSLCSAAQAAEHRFSGQRGMWHSTERMNAAYLAIGDARHEIVRGFGDLLTRVDEFGDPVLAGLERGYRDVIGAGDDVAQSAPC